MEWWNEFQAWFTSTTGSKIFLSAILPFVAIILAAVIAAVIGRATSRRLIEQQDRTHTGAAVIALIVVGRKAAIWSSLGGDEKQHVDSLMSEADIRVRLQPVNGANLAADWAAHELNAMKKNSATFSFQAEQSLIDYRDRLLSWQAKPRRARKLFSSDLNQWRYDDDSSSSSLVADRQKWATEHVEPPKTAAAQTTVIPASTATPSTTATPGLATAAPPTAAPMAAPAPAAVSTETPTLPAAVSARSAVSRPVDNSTDEVTA